MSERREQWRVLGAFGVMVVLAIAGPAWGDGDTPGLAEWEATLQRATRAYTEASNRWSVYSEQSQQDPVEVQVIKDELQAVIDLVKKARGEGAPTNRADALQGTARQLLEEVEKQTVSGDAGATPKNGLVIDRSEIGYRMVTGEGWTEIPGDGNVDRSVERHGPPCSVNVVIVDAEGLGEITEEILDAVYAEVKKQYTTETLIARNVEAWSGKPSGWYEFRGEMKGQPGLEFHLRQYFTIHNDRIFIITVTSPQSQWAEATPHWQAIIDQLEFVDRQ